MHSFGTKSATNCLAKSYLGAGGTTDFADCWARVCAISDRGEALDGNV
jgi:hypothetical protein